MCCENCKCNKCEEQKELNKPWLRTNAYCAVCEQVLKTDPETYHLTNIGTIIIEGGSGFVIDCGWGSCHDMQSFYLVVCDKCLTQLHAMGTYNPYNDTKECH